MKNGNINLKTVNKRYQLKDQLLGKGNYGQTYKTYDLIQDRFLACKMISKEKLLKKHFSLIEQDNSSNFFGQLIKNQIIIWKDLEHPNIVKFYDFSETKSNIYFFLQICSSGTLFSNFKFYQQKDIQFKISIFKQIVEAISYLHDKNICHRDLKPENILIDKGHCKVADFGFAEIHEDEGNIADMIIGSRHYMSPQIFLNQNYSLKTDIWSAGIILYELIYNQTPWSYQSTEEGWLQERKQKIRFPSLPEVPRWIKKLINSMICSDEKSRLSIKQVRKVLELGNKLDKRA